MSILSQVIEFDFQPSPGSRHLFEPVPRAPGINFDPELLLGYSSKIYAGSLLVDRRLGQVQNMGPDIVNL